MRLVRLAPRKDDLHVGECRERAAVAHPDRIAVVLAHSKGQPLTGSVLIDWTEPAVEPTANYDA